MKNIGILLVAMFVILACGDMDSKAQKTSTQIDHHYTKYADLLTKYVINGKVNYSAIKENRSHLDSLIISLETSSLEKLTDNQKLAFYINAYNMITIRSIVDAYPVKSIKDIKNVWDNKKWIISGKKLSLNEIEHEIIRKDFSEPRIHFALVCAAIGCPPLISSPYLPDSLESQFTKTAISFITNESYNFIDEENKLVQLSSIFDWYGEDFVKGYYDSAVFKNLSKIENASLNFIIEYYPDSLLINLKQKDVKIKYLDYDWSLNDLR